MVVATVLLVAGLVTVRRPMPSYATDLTLPGLTGEVSVLRDNLGIPQVYADNAADLFYAQGYVHAQDRFFQMDVRRFVTAGRLSELVGEDDAALVSDKVMRTLGLRRVAEQELPLLSPQTRNYLQSYADGVNAYIGSRSPSELSLGYTLLVRGDISRIEPWTPVDSLTWLKAMAWDLRSNYRDELGRAIAFGAVPNLDQVNLLYPRYPSEVNAPILSGTPTSAAALTRALVSSGQPSDPIPPVAVSAGAPPAELGQVDLAGIVSALDAVPELFGRGAGVGSNAWVVSGARTESGAPLLANDPHLRPSQPGIWYQVGLHCTSVSATCPFDVAGFGFAGMPGVVVGHNQTVAWGMSNLNADTTDLFLEKVTGDTYLVDGAQQSLASRRETIKVAGADDVVLSVRATGHGPLISGVLADTARLGDVAPVPDGSPNRSGGYGVALQWTALTPGRTADAVFGVNAARTVEEFRSALRQFDSPAESVVFADTDGHIGYQAVGRVPTRSGPGLGQADGTWPRLGWDSTWDWVGDVPYDQLPATMDPAEGFIVAANQQVSPQSTLSADWDYGYRAQRIRSMLQERMATGKGIASADLAAIQSDTYSYFASQVMVPVLLSAPPSDVDSTSSQQQFTADAVRLLNGWDGTQSTESPAAAYYNAVWATLIRRTFDELPKSVAPNGDSRTTEVMRGLLNQPTNPWWDDVTTPTIVETRDQIIVQALADARLELTASLGKDPQRWSWGNLHTLTPQPLLVSADSPALLRRVFNGDRLRLPGSNATVNVGSWSATSGGYQVTTVPTMRMVIDLADLDASTWVDSTGISGHPGSAHYGDQTATWARGGSYPWLFTRSRVQAAAEHTMLLTPEQDAGG